MTYDNAADAQDEDVKQRQKDFPCTREPSTLVHIEPQKACDANYIDHVISLLLSEKE